MRIRTGVLEDNKVEVQVTRSIKVGQVLRINPSAGYLGIESTIINVIGIAKWTELDTADLRGMARNFIETDCGLYGKPGEHDYDERKEELEDSLWVAYIDQSMEEYVLPLYEFVAHTMSY